jgi:poly(3-hydroxybutyrate) depolymerase
MRHASFCGISGILAILACCAVPATNVLADDDCKGRVTVSGISAGGHAAVQAHVALSGTISGAAVIAGGPYHCAEGSIFKALGRCISGSDLEAAPLVEATRSAAKAGTIDPVDSLSNDRVWLFHGTADSVVNVAVTLALRDFYASFLPEQSIAVVDDIPVTHGWPTRDQGAACLEMGGDYINACDYDAAGELLQQLYGPLNPPVAARKDGLQIMDQASVVPDGGKFADSGFAYVPRDCVDKANECRLHLAFHGCRQGNEFIEDRFARMAGLNEWAESNRIIVLYPQVSKSLMNPQGCWDWWGYTGDDYDQRGGKQIAGIAAMIGAWSE